MPSPFEIAETPLLEGVTLIEASAGTGKTYTIAGIFLRLILEFRLPVEEILAVTYTVAATEELRDRIRKRLRDALDELRKGESEDAIVGAFLDRCNSGPDSRSSTHQGIRDLDAAVQNFDQAQIFTIHGFCQRVLRNNAFETGLLFDMELISDPGEIFDQAAQDFWRQQFYLAGPLLSRLALAHQLGPGSWMDLLQKIRNHPDLRILSEAGKEPLPKLSADLELAFEGIKRSWKASHVEIAQLLKEDKGLSRNKKSGLSHELCAEAIANIEQLCANLDDADPQCLRALECLSTSGILQRTKPSKSPPVHGFFGACEDFQAVVAQYLSNLQSEFIEYARRELPIRKARLNVLSFDDLLVRFRDALVGHAGPALAGELRKQYSAALIDEFQDTDPVQYEIFRSLFAGGQHRLFFIGDPKQAIYGFRGADIFTYLKAAGGASHQYTLGTNFRSEQPLLEAVNLIFGKENPFLFEQIEYRPVQFPAEPREGFKRLIEQTPMAALQCRLLSADQGSCNQAQAEELISEAVVADIARLKASGARLGSAAGHSRPIAYGDMAVLVRSNAQATHLTNLLREKGINSVLQTDKSVFESAQAIDLLRLMEGVLEPGRDSALKTALSTCLVGLCAAQIAQSESEETVRQEWLDLFLSYRTLWESSCFMALFRRLLVEQRVRERLLPEPGGERRLTNLLHLAELIHQAETEQRLGMEALCAWLRTQRSAARSGVDEHQLRLESDDDAVLLATIHKSKGLEYPVVFCPFLWKPGDRSKRTEILFHDPAADNRLTLDLRSANLAADHDALAAMENHAEALRVAYVALTRAKNRCYLYAGEISNYASSPLARLLGEENAAAGFEKLVAAASDGCIAVTEIDDAVDQQQLVLRSSNADPGSLRARVFNGKISTARMMASFTGLLSHRSSELDYSHEEPDRDAAIPANQAMPGMATTGGALSTLGEFQRGADAGLFFHEVLEDLDFQDLGNVEDLVKKKLLSHGMATGDWVEPLCATLRGLTELPLLEGGVLRLSQISRKERLSEVEFCHPIASLTPAKLQAVFEQHRVPTREFPASLGRLQFNPVEGFMRGFIDLLFQFEGRYYLVDWKSNWLGNRLADYEAEGIKECMLEHGYYLQYHLYTLATDLFLSQRLPGYTYDKHFGGVFYLFLRGIDPGAPSRGVFHDRPDAALVESMRTLTGKASFRPSFGNAIANRQGALA